MSGDKEPGNGAGRDPRKGERNSTPPVIREMELDDLPAVYALGERLFRAEEYPTLHRTWDPYELVASYGTEGELCLVAEAGEEIVGFVTGTVIRKRRSAWTYGYLVWLGVRDDHRHLGLGRRLVNRLTDLFLAEGVRIMMVDTEASNRGALAFFNRIGFSNPEEHVYLTRNLTKLPGYQRQRERDAGPIRPARPRRPASDDPGGTGG